MPYLHIISDEKDFLSFFPKTTQSATLLASYMSAKGLDQLSAIIMGVAINFSLRHQKYFKHSLFHSNFTSFSNSLHNELAILKKCLINLLQNPVWPKKLGSPFIEIVVGRFSITSILARSILIYFSKIFWPNTMPFFTIKQHFAKLSTR